MSTTPEEGFKTQISKFICDCGHAEDCPRVESVVEKFSQMIEEEKGEKPPLGAYAQGKHDTLDALQAKLKE